MPETGFVPEERAEYFPENGACHGHIAELREMAFTAAAPCAPSRLSKNPTFGYNPVDQERESRSAI